MDLLLTIAAIVTGVITILIGLFSIASIWSDDL